MITHTNLHRLRPTASALALAAAVLAIGPARAQGVAAFDPAASSAPGMPVATPSAGTGTLPTLVHFPATADELLFSGENPRRSYPLFVTAQQSTKPAELVIEYASAVSVAPEASSLLVLVNDVPVIDKPIRVGGNQRLTAPVPPGTLQPGFNSVRIQVREAHRVDCSMTGTYELWTRLDPVGTGLRFAGPLAGPTDVSELPALPRDENGRLRITGLLNAGATPDATNRTLLAVQAAALLATAAQPDVHLGPDAGSGPGLTVAVGTYDDLGNLAPRSRTGNTPWQDVSFVPGKGTSQALLIVSGATGADVQQALSSLTEAADRWKPSGSPEGLRTLATRSGHRMDAGDAVTLADLEVDTQPFAGRLFRDEVTLALPADFYAADYDSASVVLNARYSAGLSGDAVLLVRANDVVVATLPLSSRLPGQIEDQRLRLPLDALKSGLNRVSFEAQLPRPADAACETGGADGNARFSLAGTTRIEVPALARVGHYPNLSATLAGIDGGGDPLSVYVPGNDPVALNAAGTLLARMATGSGSVRATRFVSALPHEEVGDLLAVGTYGALPEDLMAAVHLGDMNGKFDAAQRGNGGWLGLTEARAAVGEREPDEPGERLQAEDGSNASLDAFAAPVDYRARFAELAQPLVAPVVRELDRLGRRGEVETAPLPDDALVLAQAAAPIATGAAWTVLAAPNSTLLAEGTARLSSEASWTRVEGARVDVPSAANEPIVAVAGRDERLFETQPTTIANARLVLAGWFSRHTENYAAFVLGSSLLLGLSTLLLLRRLGEKNK